MCHSFQIVALCSHSLQNSLYFFDHLRVFLCRGRHCTVYFFHCCGVSVFYCDCCHYFLLSVRSVGKYIYIAHVLRSADCRLQSLMESLKIPVCSSRGITFDIIIASEIVWPPALAGSLYQTDSQSPTDLGLTQSDSQSPTDLESTQSQNIGNACTKCIYVHEMPIRK